jgi:hypothetical protein
MKYKDEKKRVLDKLILKKQKKKNMSWSPLKKLLEKVFFQVMQ